jgi:hypothetical protein
VIFELTGSKYFEVLSFAHYQKHQCLTDYISKEFHGHITYAEYGTVIIDFEHEMYYNWFLLRWV